MKSSVKLVMYSETQHDCCAVGPSSLCRGDNGAGAMKTNIGRTSMSTHAKGLTAYMLAKSVLTRLSWKSTWSWLLTSEKLSMMMSGKLHVPGRMTQLVAFCFRNLHDKKNTFFSVLTVRKPNAFAKRSSLHAASGGRIKSLRMDSWRSGGGSSKLMFASPFKGGGLTSGELGSFAPSARDVRDFDSQALGPSSKHLET